MDIGVARGALEGGSGAAQAICTTHCVCLSVCLSVSNFAIRSHEHSITDVTLDAEDFTLRPNLGFFKDFAIHCKERHYLPLLVATTLLAALTCSGPSAAI